jgi:UDP:flavonoid glycosyltransferase YjiC (YdhE family)
MTFGFIVCGSRGDVQPFLPLAVELKARAHQVKFIASENFKEFVEGFGVEFIPSFGNAEELTHSAIFLKSVGRKSKYYVTKQLYDIGNFTIKEFTKFPLNFFDEFDFLISHIFLFPHVMSIAERLNKKCGVLTLNIPSTPTRDFPFQPVGFIHHPFYNKLSYSLLKIGRFIYAKQINQFRSQIGLQKVDMLRKVFESDILTIYPMSLALISQPKDWPSNTHVTGFLNLPVKNPIPEYYDSLPEGFETWLSNGDKPIFIGFGSIPIPDQALIYQLIESLLKANERVVFILGWSTINDIAPHPNLVLIKSIDYNWLLPYCKLAIFPAGIGTIACVLKAGIPMVLLSILADQPYNAKMVADKKAAIHIPFDKLTLKKLMKAIESCQSPEFIIQVQKLSKIVNQENGVEEAATLIENYSVS